MCTNSQDNEKRHESDKTILHSTDRIADEVDIDPKLLALLDQVCASGEDALPQLKAYTDETQAENAENTHPDVESALKEFKELHAAAFATHKHTRVRRWGYRLCVIAAAIIVLNTFCIFAFGRSMYDYVAMWGAETFGYIVQKTNPEKYDPDTYYNPREQYVGELPETDPNAPLGSEENPIPTNGSKQPDFSDIPDTDVTSLGLEKTASEWGASHVVERFEIVNADLLQTVKAFGVSDKVIPTWLPEGFTQEYIQITKDHLSQTTDFFANYLNGERNLSVCISSIHTDSNAVIEKDDRPVIEYEVHNVNWYIMHNLDNINATTVVGDREVLFYGTVTVDEMKKVIDSVYEGE
ncbi:DUF4367 domain-containing protein [Agathobaculum sp. LCP25S3_E8]|uniref:DUF4367 domain-containing protein n=1 Tax=Agathobaculum sp. LCP25S3_E8 TaxID=3438735 RepID=UPI003F8D996C